MFNHSYRSATRAAKILILTFFFAFAAPEGTSIRLAFCQEPTGPGAVRFSTNISHTKAFIFNYGVNNVDFWGAQNSLATVHNHKKIPMHVVKSPTVVILTNAGLPTGGDYDMYFIASGRLTPRLAVSFPGDIGYLLGVQGAHGQALASGVRFFNGMYAGHCQTFSAFAETETNEETGNATTTISLFYFSPGLVFDNGDSELPPSFVLLKKFVSSNNNPDPDIVLSQEFSLPIPHSYYVQTSPDYPEAGEYALIYSKSLSVPKESVSNSYFPNKSNTGC